MLLLSAHHQRTSVHLLFIIHMAQHILGNQRHEPALLLKRTEIVFFPFYDICQDLIMQLSFSQQQIADCFFMDFFSLQFHLHTLIRKSVKNLQQGNTADIFTDLTVKKFLKASFYILFTLRDPEIHFQTFFCVRTEFGPCQVCMLQPQDSLSLSFAGTTTE